MTTIVYCHKRKQIAVDSRVTMGTTIVSDALDKCIKRDNHYFFVACSIQDIENILAAYLNKEIKWTGDKFATLIVTPDGKVFEFYNVDTKLYSVPVTFNAACGSGGDWALAALDFGCNAVAAIEYAMTKDSATGGPIYLHNVVDAFDSGYVKQLRQESV